MGQLDGQVAIITGGGSGIGKAIARAFVREGCSVVIAGRTRSRLEQTVQELGELPGEIVAIPTDVTDEPQVQALFRQTLDRFGKLDILVNSSGAFDGGPIEEISLETWDKVIGANLTGPFLCTREAFRIMKPARRGRIVNIGSISAQRTRVNMAPYTASKFGIWGLTQAAALEGRDYGIAVSCLHPGNTLTERRAQGQAQGRNQDLEPMLSVDDMARVALLMVTLPPEANMLEAIVLPLQQLYLGRG